MSSNRTETWTFVIEVDEREIGVGKVKDIVYVVGNVFITGARVYDDAVAVCYIPLKNTNPLTYPSLTIL